MNLKKTKIIAEIGNTHEGSLGLAKQMIRVARNCGADAVKFQCHIFDSESLDSAPNPPYFKDETRRQYFERTSFTKDQWMLLKEYTEKDCKTEFLVSPFSNDAVDLMESIGINAFKVASGEVTNVPMLSKIAITGKPVYLSSGMSNWSELDRAVKVLMEKGCPELTILQCTSDYPCLPENAGLNILDELKTRYPGHKYGFSDHTLGMTIPIAAVCLGATVVEKHFTLSKEMYGSDAKFSAEPKEFEDFVTAVRDLERALCSRVNKNKKAETLHEMKSTFEKSIVAARSLQKGQVLCEDDLAYKKPAIGLSASCYKEVLGSTLKNSLKKDMLITREDIQ